MCGRMKDNGNLGAKIKIKHFDDALKKTRVTECSQTDQGTDSGLSEMWPVTKNRNWLTRSLVMCLHYAIGFSTGENHKTRNG